MNNRKIKLYWNICMTGSIIVTVIIGIYVGLHWYWKKNITEEIGYSHISNLIAAIGIPINIATIIFVFRTYNQQRKQIEKNDKDTEFNRLLDIIYKQLEHTRIKYNADAEQLFKICDGLEEGNMPIILDNLEAINSALRILHYEGDFYAEIIERCGLDDYDKAYLYNIYNNNVPEHYIGLIYNLSDFGESYGNGDEFKEAFSNAYLNYFYGESYDGKLESRTGLFDSEAEVERRSDSAKDAFTNFDSAIFLSNEIVKRNQHYGKIFDRKKSEYRSVKRDFIRF